MLKTYELMDRHFQWETRPRPATENQRVHYLLDRALLRQLIFGYEHVFEAYVPRDRRIYGYLGLPVMVDGEIVAVLDLKTDRIRQELLIQKWTWVGQGNATLHKARIEEKLHLFEQFQIA